MPFAPSAAMTSVAGEPSGIPPDTLIKRQDKSLIPSPFSEPLRQFYLVNELDSAKRGLFIDKIIVDEI